MSESLRAFLAVDLPERVREQVAAAQARLRAAAPEPVRWTPPEKLHLTLKFLGDAFPAEQIPRLVSAVASRLARLERFEVALAGYGAFPSAREARVLWIGVAGGARELGRLARRLDAAGARAGTPRDKRPFRAHLTLGRLRRAVRVDTLALECPAIDPFPVEEVVLFQSRTDPGGSSYVPLARVPLGGATELYETDFAPEI